MKIKIVQFGRWMNALKYNRKALVTLIGINAFMGIISNIVDWNWLMSVDWYLRPFTPICSLYPLSLAVWYTIFYFRKKVPSFYTHFVFIGIVSYGIMAYIYYPVSMLTWGWDWRLFGNMIWVTIYALQSFMIRSELKKIPLYQFALITGYFLFKDYADRFLGTFIDVRGDDYPLILKNFFGLSILLIHCGVFVITRKIDAIKMYFIRRLIQIKEEKAYPEVAVGSP